MRVFVIATLDSLQANKKVDGPVDKAGEEGAPSFGIQELHPRVTEGDSARNGELRVNVVVMHGVLRMVRGIAGIKMAVVKVDNLGCRARRSH